MTAPPPTIAPDEHIDFLHWSLAQQVSDRVQAGATPQEATRQALDATFGILARQHPDMLALYAGNLQARYTKELNR